ncbi:2910_t:CDS:2, partial [Gigaspora rosea]
MQLKAALVLEESEEDLRTTLFIEANNKKFVLCNLISGVHEQQNLNVTLLKGEDVKLYSVGHNKIHLTGNYIKIIDHDDSESRPEELSSSIICKPNGDMNVKKMLNIDDESSESSPSESKDVITNTEEDSDEDFSEGDNVSDKAVIKKEINENGKHQKRANDDNKDKQNVRAAKKQKTENEVIEPKRADVSIEPNSAAVSSKAQKKKKNKERNKKKPDVKTETSTKKVLESEKPKTEDGNKHVEPRDKDLIDSDSKEKEKKVQVRYIGRMNDKVFDKNVSGKPFHFTLGKGEVIKGISGMRIGGERKLTIPPQQAYGSAGSPPVIPKNATLVFQ